MATTVLQSYLRSFSKLLKNDRELGPLSKLPGVWRSSGTGWNMIALPFAAPAGPPYRVLVNQYEEELEFSLVDKAVPNRGLKFVAGQCPAEEDQFLVTLDYQQKINNWLEKTFQSVVKPVFQDLASITNLAYGYT
jgi:hypothetical protein